MDDETKPKSLKEKLAAAKFPERTVQICLRGDLQAEFEELDRQLKEAEKRGSDSLAGSGARAVAEQIEALREQMLDHTVRFRLRAMPRHEFKALVADHPPRKTETGDVHPSDQFVGVNFETFFDVLIRASIVEPELDDEDWATLDAHLTDRQFDQLVDASWALNRREVDVPFSRAASKTLGNASE